MREQLKALKKLPSTLGVVKVSDLNDAVDSMILDLDMEAATKRGDFEEVARLQNAKPKKAGK